MLIINNNYKPVKDFCFKQIFFLALFQKLNSILIAVLALFNNNQYKNNIQKPLNYADPIKT